MKTADISKKTLVIGLSLSQCIKSILAGEVNPEQVIKIISRTNASTLEDWNQLIARYRTQYWERNPERGEALLRQFLTENKIKQSRKIRQWQSITPDLSNGIWVTSERDISWRSYFGDFPS